MLSEESFEHLVILAETLTHHECLSLANEILLHRLFHSESLKHLVADPVHFACSCSQKKMLKSLTLLSDEELEESLAEHNEISVTCEFCLNHFSFNELDIKTGKSIQGNATKH
jgi:molecular chaperone Hsp33